MKASRKEFLTATVRAMRGAGVTQKIISDAMGQARAKWAAWSVEERTLHQVALVDIQPMGRFFVCYMDTWETADGDRFPGDRWTVTYRGAGHAPRVEAEFSTVADGGGTFWEVRTSNFRYE